MNPRDPARTMELFVLLDFLQTEQRSRIAAHSVTCSPSSVVHVSFQLLIGQCSRRISWHTARHYEVPEMTLVPFEKTAEILRTHSTSCH